MTSLRLNPRVVSPLQSRSLRTELHTGEVRIALKRLTPQEAEYLGLDQPGHAILSARPGELQELCAAAQENGLGDLADAIVAAVSNFHVSDFVVPLARGALHLGERTLVMGVVNVTPDSFSDGGQFLDRRRAIEHALEMVEHGADLIDIGGESTRPGAEPVAEQEELDRVLPVVEAAVRTGVPVSIDTLKAVVARQAMAAGAQIINDVSGLRADPAMAATAAEASAAVVLMHMQGTPRDMQVHPHYDDLMDEVCRALRESLALARQAGIRPDRTIIDPGIGFGKSAAHNLEILDRLGELRSLGRPILIGTSRKSTIGAVLNAPVDKRLFGTAATVAVAVRNGAHIVRVHDVPEMVDVARMTDAIGNWQAAAPAKEPR